MRIPARQITEFCSIWSSAKADAIPPERAIGDYPSHGRQYGPNGLPELSILVTAKVQRQVRSVVVLPSPARPAPLPYPQAELQPSDRVFKPKSLGPAVLVQNKKQAWDCSPMQIIWDQRVRQLAERRRPEYEYRPTRHRIWRRDMEKRRPCGLGRQSIQRIAWNASRQDVSGLEAQYKKPELTPRPIPVPIGAEAVRPIAQLRPHKPLTAWDPCTPPPQQGEPLKFIGPSFGVSIPEPSPLR